MFRSIKIKKGEKGFVILYAVIITTVVLVVGVSLMNIMTKQLVLSSISRNAKVSYYAAQAGRDCSEHWIEAQGYSGRADVNNYFGGTYSDEEGNPHFVAPTNGNDIKCVGLSAPMNFSQSAGNDPNTGASNETTSFKFTLDVKNPLDSSHPQQVCAVVSVVVTAGVGVPCINADGYNISCEDYNANLISGNWPPRLVKSHYQNTCD
jgi:hypothetical protein